MPSWETVQAVLASLGIKTIADVVALGTMAKRPQTWTLLGMIRADTVVNDLF